MITYYIDNYLKISSKLNGLLLEFQYYTKYKYYFRKS